MAEAPVTILGGLPVIAQVSFSRDYWTGECDADVDDLFWMKRDGSKGKSIPQHLFDKATADYKNADIIEQVVDHLAYADREDEEPVTLTTTDPASESSPSVDSHG